MDPEILAEGPAIADEKPADTTEIAPAVAPDAESAPAAVETPAKPDRDKVQERFDKLTREKYEALRAKDALEWELQKLRESQAKTPPVAPAQRPKLADFEYDESRYEAAVIEWTQAAARQAAESVIRMEREQESAKARVDSFRARESKFAEKHADYREVVYDESIPISTAMAEAIRDSDEGPALAYYLAKNRDVAEAISTLPPFAAARELGKIEARLTAPPPAPPVSAAPPPPPKLSATEPAIDKDPSQMTDAEFAKWRKRQIAQRRTR